MRQPELAGWPAARIIAQTSPASFRGSVRVPRLQDGTDYDVMLRNLWRLLAWGFTIAEARPVVLAKAGVSVFPDPRTSRTRPTFEIIVARTATRSAGKTYAE